MSEGQIHEAIIAVMQEVGAVGKDCKNTQQGYQYRSIDAIYNRIHPLFARHGIYAAPTVIDQKRETGKTKSGGTLHYSILTVEYRFIATDGSSVSVTVVGEGMDSGDKASNKAMTAAHKYALCQVLHIPYDLVDSDRESPEMQPSSVTIGQLNTLKKAWAARHGKKSQTEDEQREAFRKWAKDTIGPNSKLGGDFNPLKWSEWTVDEYEVCIGTCATD